MIVAARTALFACLSVVLAQFALPERESAAIGGVCYVAEATQFEHAAHPATFGAHAYLADGVRDRLTTSPFAAARSAFGARFPDAVDAPAQRGFALATDDAILLPPARAPPLLS